jgi:hypothetical protein
MRASPSAIPCLSCYAGCDNLHKHGCVLEGLRAQKLALNPIKDQGYLDAARETVCPLQPACGHLQAMSGVFSIASHSVLQYFPDVTLQEQTG